MMNEILYEKVMERAGKNQMIIFVHSRRQTSKTALTLKEQAFSQDELTRLVKEDSDNQKILKVIVEKEKITNNDLKELLPFGIAIHHAGMTRDDRELVEHLFAAGHI